MPNAFGYLDFSDRHIDLEILWTCRQNTPKDFINRHHWRTRVEHESPHTSVTHLHLFSMVNTFLQARNQRDKVRVLDIGCGDGNLIVYLHKMMTRLFPETPFEIHGFDVVEQGHGMQSEFQRAIDVLNETEPTIDWRQRVKVISANDAWPYPDEYFDIAVSNQVLEHVSDTQPFFSSLERVLRRDGTSFHLFPLRQSIIESHVKVPFAHWIKDQRFQEAWIAFSNRLGIGRWKTDKVAFDQSNINDYAISQARYLNTNTYYRRFAEFHRTCKANSLSVSYNYTSDFYAAKLRELFGAKPKFVYRDHNAFVEFLLYSVLSFVSSVSLVVSPISYNIALRIHQEKEYQKRQTKSAA